MTEKEKTSLLDDTLKQNAIARGTLTRKIQYLGKVKESYALELIEALKNLSQKGTIALPEGEITQNYVTKHWQTIETVIESKIEELEEILTNQRMTDREIPSCVKDHQSEKDRLLIEKNVLKSIPPERAEMLLRLRKRFEKFTENNGSNFKYEKVYRDVINLLHEGKVVFNGMKSTDFPELDIALHRKMAPLGDVRDVFLNTERPEFITEKDWISGKKRLKEMIDTVEVGGKFIANRENAFDKILKMLPGFQPQNKIAALHLLWQAEFDHLIVSYGKNVTYTNNTPQENRFHDYIFGPYNEDHYREGIMSYFQDGGTGSLPLASKISERKEPK